MTKAERETFRLGLDLALFQMQAADLEYELQRMGKQCKTSI
jgi:hypothetical protein